MSNPWRVSGVLSGLAGLLLLSGCAMATAAADLPDATGGVGGVSIGGVAVPEAVPVEHREWLAKAGTDCPDITPSIRAAQIDAESSWRTDALSRDGHATVGLTQFLSATWATYGRDDDGNGRISREDPGDAIMAQGRYICDLYGQMKQAVADRRVTGDPIELAIGAYNAGPARMISGGMAGAPDETKKYVPHVMNLARTKYAVTVALPTSAVGGEVGERIAQFARTGIGVPYSWGGGTLTGPGGGWSEASGPSARCRDGEKVGWDCSGFTRWAVYQGSGKETPRTADQQANWDGFQVIPSDLALLRPGDLIAFNNSGRVGGYDHIGVYVGDGKMIHAPQSCDITHEVTVASGYYGDPSQWRVLRLAA